MKTLTRLSVLVAIGSAAFASNAHAALVATDSFETYVPGADLNGNNGGTGFTTAWSANGVVDVVTASLSYKAGSVDVNGGAQAAQITGTPATSPFDNLASRGYTGQSSTVYMSFLFRPVVNGGLDQDDFLQFHFNDDTDEANAGSIGMRNSAANNGYFARVRDNAANNEASANIDSVQGQTDFLIAKFSKGGSGNFETLAIFVNPTSGIEPVVPNAVATLNSLTSLIDFFSLRSATLEATDRYQFDALTIGTQFSDVINIIPEPATATLSLLAMAGLIRRPRARKA